MQALHSRGDFSPSVYEAPASRTAASRIPARSGVGRPWLAAALALVGLSAAAYLSFFQLPLPISIGEGAQPSILSVGVGSELWLQGIRPDMVAELQAGGSTLRLLLPGNLDFRFPLAAQAGDFPVDVAVGIMVVLAAALLGLARLPGSAAVAGAGVAIAIGPALPQLGLPAALPLALLSAGTAAAAVRIADRRMQRAFDVFGLLVGGLIIAAALLLMREIVSVSWSYVWLAPLFIAIALGVIGEALAVRARLASIPVGAGSRLSRLLSAIVPLAASSRLEGADEERSRLAIELHNEVLPKVRSSARAARSDQTAEQAAARLEALETDLRDVMKRHETVTLELGGLVDALRVYAESLDTHGIRVTLEADRGTGKRPPANVEVAAYRIGQSAVENAIRHSGADRIDVSVTARPERVELIVRDDGVGIDPATEMAARRRGRLGIAQMRLRAEAAGGSLNVHGRAGEGTEIRFDWSA